MVSVAEKPAPSEEVFSPEEAEEEKIEVPDGVYKVVAIDPMQNQNDPGEYLVKIFHVRPRHDTVPDGWRDPVARREFRNGDRVVRVHPLDDDRDSSYYLEDSFLLLNQDRQLKFEPA
jgi:hypothetical protein